VSAQATASAAPQRRVSRARLRRGAAPYALLSPGMVWLIIFFVVPMAYLAKMSLETGLFPLFSFDWAWHNFSDAVSAYRTQFVRSLAYSGAATAIALAISYPLAYWIAFRGGRWKNLFLLLVIAPFFVTYLIRTLAWQTILADNGIVVRVLRDVHLLGADGRLLATSIAVVAGITYNFLPFMVLPLYVSLEQVDPRLIEAAEDLYANRARSFLRVTLPLSLPGVFAGVLLTFIPAAGDFINAQLLGTPRQYMIGNVIQSQFLSVRDYPTAAALSFVLMGAILVLVLVFTRLLGTDRLTAAAAAT
jgi:spermidine/putrescine transport system permease protein